jgi:hypothetical protein
LAFEKTFSATDAAVSLDDSIFILEVAETLGFAVTTMTIQLDLSGRNRLSLKSYLRGYATRTQLNPALLLRLAVLKRRQAFVSNQIWGGCPELMRPS